VLSTQMVVKGNSGTGSGYGTMFVLHFSGVYMGVFERSKRSMDFLNVPLFLERRLNTVYDELV